MNPEIFDTDLPTHWAVPLNEPDMPDVIPFPISPIIPQESSDDQGFLLRGIEPSDEGFHPHLRRFDEAA